MSKETNGGVLRGALARPGSFVHALRAVAWSFFGVRKASDHAIDMERINPLHLVVTAVVAALLFVVGLVALVRWVVASGVAG